MALTRDDVVVSKVRKFRIPFLLHIQGAIVNVAGRDYEIVTIKAPLITATDIRPTGAPLARLHTADIEQAIIALLDVLNTQARDSD